MTQTITEIIQTLEAKLTRALQAKQRHKRRAEAYRDGLRSIVELPAGAPNDCLVRVAITAIDKGDKSK